MATVFEELSYRLARANEGVKEQARLHDRAMKYRIEGAWHVEKDCHLALSREITVTIVDLQKALVCSDTLEQEKKP